MTCHNSGWSSEVDPPCEACDSHNFSRCQILVWGNEWKSDLRTRVLAGLNTSPFGYLAGCATSGNKAQSVAIECRRLKNSIGDYLSSVLAVINEPIGIAPRLSFAPFQYPSYY
jgi:hypothetical protein